MICGNKYHSINLYHIDATMDLLRRKQPDIIMITISCDTVEEYNHLITPEWRRLTKDEFDELQYVLKPIHE